MSAILLTSAPSWPPCNDISSSGDTTPSLSRKNLFSRAIAIWMGMRHGRSASHSPALKRETGQSELDRNSRVKEWKGCADTTILLSSSLVGLREVFSKLEIISEKWEENGRRWSSVTNTSVFCLRWLEDVIVWRFTAATTGKRDHTSLWNSIKQLWTVCLP